MNKESLLFSFVFGKLNDILFKEVILTLGQFVVEGHIYSQLLQVNTSSSV